MGNAHLVNVACVLSFFAFQIHILTMAVSDYAIGTTSASSATAIHKDNVIQAFIILAYALFIIGLILSIMMTRSGLASSNITAVITAIVLIIAAGSVVIGLAVLNHYIKEATTLDLFQTYWISSFTVASACGLVGGILLLVGLCC